MSPGFPLFRDDGPLRNAAGYLSFTTNWHLFSAARNARKVKR
jgi:hypothetical protein